MKKPWYIAYVVIAALLIVAALYGIVESIAFDSTFYDDEYTKYGQAEVIGMSHADLMKTTEKLIDHMTGKSEDMVVYATIDGTEREVFNNQEKLHMLDVNALLRGFDIFKWAAFGIAAAAIVLFFFICRRDRLRTIAKAVLTACIFLAVIFGAVGAWAAIDFNSFWTGFHHMLFRNELWMMDPAQCVMINMFPAEFFSDFVMLFLKRAALIVGVPLLACGGVLLFIKKTDKTKH